MKTSPQKTAAFAAVGGLALALAATPSLAGDSVELPCPGCTLVPDDQARWSTPDAPPVDIDWSFGLRGGIVQNSSGTHYQAIALPDVSIGEQTLRGGYSLHGNAELSVTDAGSFRIDDAKLSLSSTYAFDAVTTANFATTVETSQDAPDAPGEASNVAEAPRVTSIDTSASITRDLGLLSATLKAGASRSLHGDTILDDASIVDNTDQNTTDYSGGGRLAVKLSPGLSAFIDGDAIFEAYDVASPTLMVKLDNRTYEAKIGLSGKWNDVFSLEGAVGLAYRDFTDASLNDISAVIYDASAEVHPNETITLAADVSTTLGAPTATSGGTATLTHAANASAAVLVNPWLRLRGSIGASQSETIGSTDTTSTLKAGAGADYLVNSHTDLTADYTFERNQTGTDPAEDVQTLMLGVTVHR